MDTGPGTLKQFRQLGEDRGRVALACRRLADGQRNFPLGHGKTGDAVHKTKNALALIAKILRDRHRQVGSLAADQGCLVRGGDDDDTTGQTSLAQIVFDEFARLTTALANQADDTDLGVGMARHHGKQCGLADPRARKDPHALPPTTGEEGVYRPDAEVNFATDPLARVGGRRLIVYGVGHPPGGQWPFTIEGLAEGIDDAAQPARAGVDHGFRDAELGAATRAHPVEGPKRHQ